MSTPQAPTKVAIIGGGLAGLSLALSLNLHSPTTKYTIYELRAPTTSTTGALMLSPNALKILDDLNVYQRIKNQGYEFESVISRRETGEVMDEYWMGSESAFGYKALRVYRQVLLDELRAVAAERGIEIVYGKRFSHVVEESEEGVTFEFDDGTKETAGLLVGADGIHSTVRKYIHPGMEPKYSGITAVTAAVERSSLRFPEPETEGKEYHMPVSIHGQHGAFVMAPQNPEGTELLIGRQARFEEREKAGWDVLRKDTNQLLSFLQADKQDWPEIVRSAMEGIMQDKLSIWPFYVVPPMTTWSSPAGHVLILGDAAHAIPPTAGQGASQAFEDVFSFSLLLSKTQSKSNAGISHKELLGKWEKYRMARIGQIMELTRKLNGTRANAEEQKAMRERGEEVWMARDLGVEGQRWLFEPQIEEGVEGLLKC
ncbi:hypothetical protein B0J14DRAFT_702877 [Halenospora varia]|nr:hypothetical protein B0J14DRAFT_702877 [Halenospora varia]